MSNKNNKNLSIEQQTHLLTALRERFEDHMNRHNGLNWAKIESRLTTNSAKLKVLFEMEATGGEPDVIGCDETTGEYIFCDCSPESPKGRRSLCYDAEALEARKANKPINSAMQMASEMGIELMDEVQYRKLQELDAFDTKTSSWLKTPDQIRKLGGAIFGDRRYGRIFVYHNGAESYYGARGFRGLIRI
jgi:hypothetical protein